MTTVVFTLAVVAAFLLGALVDTILFTNPIFKDYKRLYNSIYEQCHSLRKLLAEGLNSIVNSNDSTNRILDINNDLIGENTKTLKIVRNIIEPASKGYRNKYDVRNYYNPKYNRHIKNGIPKNADKSNEKSDEK